MSVEKDSVVKSRASFIARHRSSLLLDLTAALILIIALLFCKHGALATLDSEYLGGSHGDPGLYIWLTKTIIRDLFSHGPYALPWFNTHGFYPYGTTLAWSDNYIFPALLVGALTPLAHPLAYNITLLLAQFLFAYCSYRLIISLTGSFAAAACGAILALPSLYLTAHLGHPQLQWLFVLPAALFCVISYRNQRRPVAAIGLGLILSLSLLCSIYHTLLTALSAALFYLALLLIKRRGGELKECCICALWCAVGLLPAIPFLLPYLTIKETFGTRELYEAFYLSANLHSYLSVSPLSTLSSILTTAVDEERNLFPGFVLCIGVLAALWRLLPPKRLRKELSLCVASIVTLCAISALPELSDSPELTKIFRPYLTATLWIVLVSGALLVRGVAQLETKLQVHYITGRDLIGISLWCALFFLALSLGPIANASKDEFAWSPYTALYAVVPGFDGLRAICRAGLYVHFFLILALSLTLAAIKRNVLRNTACAACALLSLYEQFPRFIPKEALSTTPAAYQMVQTLSEKDTAQALISLPLVRSLSPTGEVEHWSQYAEINTNYLNWSSEIALKSVNGYSGIRSKMMRELPRELQNFPDIRSIAALRKIAGLRYIVYIPAYAENYSEDAFAKKLKPLLKDLDLRGIDPAGNIVLSLKGDKPLEESSPLALPPYTDHTLRVTLRAQKTEATFAAYEDLLSLDTALVQEKLAPFEQREIIVPLSPPTNKVRPRLLRLQSAPAGALTLVATTYDDPKTE